MRWCSSSSSPSTSEAFSDLPSSVPRRSNMNRHQKRLKKYVLNLPDKELHQNQIHRHPRLSTAWIITDSVVSQDESQEVVACVRACVNDNPPMDERNQGNICNCIIFSFSFLTNSAI